MSAHVAFDARRRQTNDTRDAYCIIDPNSPLKVIYLPRSQVDSMVRAGRDGYWTFTVPEWLAEQHDLA